MSFTLPDLPYAYDALQPYMSKETLEFHHDKHHQAYVTNGNNLLKGSEFEGKSLRGIRIWRIGGGAYDPAAAAAAALRQAEEFLSATSERLRTYRREAGRRGLIVFAIDTELIGHWWSEGPIWLRAVLEGVAQRGADLVEAAEADTGRTIPSLRIDGGMSDNPTFVQALADATQRPVEVSPVREATTHGAAYLAGLAVGTWSGWDEVAATWSPRAVVEPGEPLDRERWRRAVDRAAEWHPDLSGLSF